MYFAIRNHSVYHSSRCLSSNGSDKLWNMLQGNPSVVRSKNEKSHLNNLGANYHFTDEKTTIFGKVSFPSPLSELYPYVIVPKVKLQQ